MHFTWRHMTPVTNRVSPYHQVSPRHDKWQSLHQEPGKLMKSSTVTAHGCSRRPLWCFPWTTIAQDVYFAEGTFFDGNGRRTVHLGELLPCSFLRLRSLFSGLDLQPRYHDVGFSNYFSITISMHNCCNPKISFFLTVHTAHVSRWSSTELEIVIPFILPTCAYN